MSINKDKLAQLKKAAEEAAAKAKAALKAAAEAAARMRFACQCKEHTQAPQTFAPHQSVRPHLCSAPAAAARDFSSANTGSIPMQIIDERLRAFC